MKVKKVVAVFKTHFDIGFTDLSSEVVKNYSGKMLKDVLKTCRSTEALGAGKRFKWTMSAWPLLKTLEYAEKGDLAEAETRIREGALCTHALPYTIHTEFTGEEELNRMFFFSKRFCDRYGIAYPGAAKMTDVPGHTFLLASLLSSAGVKLMHIGCNPGSHKLTVPPLFWWEGPDGKRMLTMYNKTYGTDALPPKDWNFPVWLQLMVSNDNTGPQDASVVELLERQVKTAFGENTEFTVGTMDDFYAELSKSDLSSLPVIRSDFADSWIHGVQSYPRETSLLRRNRRKLTAFEKYINLYGEESGEIKAKLDELYETALLYCEHTMGLNVIVDLAYDRKYDKAGFTEMRSQANHLRMEASWQEQRDRCDSCVAGTEELCRKYAGGEGLFNPSAYPFAGSVDITDIVQKPDGKCGRIGDRFYADCKIEGLGVQPASALLPCELPEVYESELFVELKNEYARVKVAKASGAVVEFFDNATGKNYAKTIGEYQYDVCNLQDITDYLKDYAYYYFDWINTAHGRMAYPDNFEHYRCPAKAESVTAYHNAVKVTLLPQDSFSVSEYGNARKIEVIYSLIGNALNVRVKVIDKQASPMVEGIHFNFDLNFTNPDYTINKVGSRVDPATDIIEGANNILYCLENWVDITDGETGLCIVSHDAPLFSIGDETMYKFSPVYQKRQDCKVLFNLSNNMWGTNFPQWIEGSFEFEFDLIPHFKAGVDPEQLSRCKTAPPVFAAVSKAKFPLSIEGAELLSVLKSEDGGMILRLKRKESTDGFGAIKGDFAGCKCCVCDLYEREISEAAQKKGAITLPMRAFETVSLKIKR